MRAFVCMNGNVAMFGSKIGRITFISPSVVADLNKYNEINSNKCSTKLTWEKSLCFVCG